MASPIVSWQVQHLPRQHTPAAHDPNPSESGGLGLGFPVSGLGFKVYGIGLLLVEG